GQRWGGSKRVATRFAPTSVRIFDPHRIGSGGQVTHQWDVVWRVCPFEGRINTCSSGGNGTKESICRCMAAGAEPVVVRRFESVNDNRRRICDHVCSQGTPATSINADGGVVLDNYPV